MNSVEIKSDKQGFNLMVDGLYIHKSFDGSKIIAIRGVHGKPYGASEWVSVQDIRQFWNENRMAILESTKEPHASIWGELVPLQKELL